MKRVKGTGGFTVIEVMIALVVLSVGILGLVTTAALVTRMIGRAHRATTASLYAAQKMEEVRALLVSIRNCAVVASGSDAVGPASAYQRRWNIRVVGLERWVTVSVTYPAGPEQIRTDNVATVVSCAP